MRSSKLRFLILAILAVLLAAVLCLCACSGQSGDDGKDDPQVIVIDASGDNNIPAFTPIGTASPVEPSEALTVEPTESANNTETVSSDSPSVSPDASETQSAGTEGALTPTPTASATQGGSATPAPTATNKPDPVTSPVWFDDSAPVSFDMDFDGNNEKVEISLKQQSGYTYTCTVSVTVGATGKQLTDSFSVEYFTKALINNFNSGDGRAELLVCCGSGNRGQITKAYRLNANSNGLNSFGVNGWVETYSGNAIELGRYMDVLGTWACSAEFEFSASDFSLVQKSAEWTIHRDDPNRWCTVKKTLIVELFINNSTENYAGFLSYGDKIYPTSTDMSSYIKFVSDLEDRGAITVTPGSNGTLLISGESPDNWFSDLQYIR